MKIVSWNCAGGFRKKFEKIKNLNPDIIIIQECENPNLYKKEFLSFEYKSFIWEGESKNKGIGIFTKPNLKLQKLEWNHVFEISISEIKSDLLKWNSKDLKQFLPFSINDNIHFIAVWTKGNENQAFGYVGQFWKYILANKNEILNQKPIIIGDFNSNKIWDKIDRWWNHSEIINILESWNYKSLYHEKFQEEQGKEKNPTFFLQRKREKPYHIDYAFIQSVKLKKASLELGKFEDWIEFSDHLPLIIEFDK
ncbi:endonuclease/exonuclease/phosphatase family protein [Leptospira kanakyensis]|uniref:endonuclease/exonuclease/phosphatase family protein n=1 Tax=Leptospira kanakyensis TaxID=2484968 RepID=UPI00223C96DB|nr:endonuclease/exonuclease/phosphatase family protein [Leptospira kanakyensis]MCW7471732.1 endonuclease/exonuclease/phosphatase family protein [Leptospira kanakyensis]